MDEREERLRAIGLEVRDRVSGKLGDVWWAFMLRGVLAGLLGIFACSGQLPVSRSWRAWSGSIAWPTLCPD
jgi:hypothetical protein